MRFLRVGTGSAVAAIALAYAEPTVSDILPRVQSRLHQFFASLPDFTCMETMESQTVIGGKVRQDRRAVSEFTGHQSRAGIAEFTESRKRLSIDGTPVPGGAKPPVLKNVYNYGGGFSSVLNETFSAKFAAWQHYRIAGSEIVGGEDCIVLEMETDDAESKLALDWFGKTVRPHAQGRASITRDSMEVLKLERHYSGLPKNIIQNVAVEYGRVAIAGQSYLMPKTVRAWTTGARETSSYTATYSDYRKFDVATDVTYQ